MAHDLELLSDEQLQAILEAAESRRGVRVLRAVTRRLVRLLPPTEPGDESESIWSRARRDTTRVRGTIFVRAVVGALDLALAVFIAEALVSANKPNAQVAILTVIGFVGAPFAALGLIYVAQGMLALPRQRDEARRLVREDRVEFARSLDREKARFDEFKATHDAEWERAHKQTDNLREQLGLCGQYGRQLSAELDEIRAERDALRVQIKVEHPAIAPIVVQLGKAGDIHRNIQSGALDGLQAIDAALDEWINETALSLRAHAPDWETEFTTDTFNTESRRTVWTANDMMEMWAAQERDRLARFDRHVTRLRAILAHLRGLSS